jgi:putative acetyltransferase
LTLAPLAVEPAFQKTGVGQRLVEAGIKKAREALFQVIVAFGNPEFYARLKFRHAPSLSTNLPESIHHNQFMTYDLIHESNPPVEGCITFPKEYFLLDYPEENRTKSR